VRRTVIWLLAAFFAIVATVFIFCPAAWLAPLVEDQTGGRITLGDAQGSIWRGSASIGAAPSQRDAFTPLMPGRFTWRLSPLVLLGMVNLELINPEVLTQPVVIVGSWSRWMISPATIGMPAHRLVALGAPLNTIMPSGNMALSWDMLEVIRRRGTVDLLGSMQLNLTDIGSRLSPIKPLGAYQLKLDWQGQQAVLQLKTVYGPLLLSGSGEINNGRARFSGRAEAAPGQQDKLNGLLGLLGRRRVENGSNYIVLEFN
jgi:general secretion pathway protein N